MTTMLLNRELPKISRSAYRCALIIAMAGQTNSQGKRRSKRWMWSVPAANVHRRWSTRLRNPLHT